MSKAPELQRIYLREWRKHRQLNQEQLAERVGVDRTIISKIENGKLGYHQAFLEAAAEALMCEPADLLVRDPSKPESIWSVWESIPPVQRPQVLAVIQALKNTGQKTGS
jgi:transcriptional regulator with XRE-family HTH domain